VIAILPGAEGGESERNGPGRLLVLASKGTPGVVKMTERQLKRLFQEAGFDLADYTGT
jgi:hypothetical protein